MCLVKWELSLVEWRIIHTTMLNLKLLLTAQLLKIMIKTKTSNSISVLFVSILSSTEKPYVVLNSTDLPIYIKRALARVCSYSLMRVKYKHTTAGDAIYDELVAHSNTLHALQMRVNELERKKVEQAKWDSIQSMITRARANVKLYSPFFVCSTHEHCACGHEAYQGKLYYDEKWQKYTNRGDLERVGKYIKQNGLISLQRVISKPTLLVSRINCRHFFTKVSLDLVLSGKAIKAPYLSNLGSKSYEQLQYLKYDRKYKEAREIARIIPDSKKARLKLARLEMLRKKWLELSRTNFSYKSSSCSLNSK